MKYKIKYSFTLLFLALLGLGSCKKTDETPLQPLPLQIQGATKTVAQVLAEEPRYSSFYAACVKVGLDKEFSSPVSTLTIFVPNNDAFASANLGSVSDDVLKNTLRYHIVNVFANNYFRFAANFQTGRLESSAQLPNNEMHINVPVPGKVLVNGNTVVKADVAAVNGVIHEINGVLLVPSQAMYDIISDPLRASDFSLFKAAIDRTAGLPSAPNATNLRALLQSTRTFGTAPGGTVPGLLAGSNLTVFVPTNAAFNTAGFADVTAINAAPLATIQRILQHHVSQITGVDRVYNDAFVSGPLFSLVTAPARRPVVVNVKSVNEIVLNEVSSTGGDPIGFASGYNRAKIIGTLKNITATNGVIHGIDRVLQAEN